MQNSADFLNSKVNNSVILQTMAHILSSMSVALFDGLAKDKMQMLALEMMRFCES